VFDVLSTCDDNYQKCALTCMDTSVTIIDVFRIDLYLLDGGCFDTVADMFF